MRWLSIIVALVLLGGCTLQDLNEPFLETCGDSCIAADVAAGADHTCLLTTAGAVYCWGRNDLAQVGPMEAMEVATPTFVPIDGVATAIAAGGHNTCVVIGGGVQCWGDNSHEQLGAPAATVPTSGMPLWVSGVMDVHSLGVGYWHVCARSPMSVTCWGQNASCELGIGPDGASQSAVPLGDAFVGPSDAIGAGDGTTCVVTRGGLECWGFGRFSVLGNGAEENACTPIAVDFGGTTEVVVSDVRVGGDPGPMETDHGGHACAISDRGVYCWGRNENYQVGNDTMDPPPSPAAISLMNATLVATGGHHTCAGSDGHVVCWGQGERGQLGAGAEITSAHRPRSPETESVMPNATRLSAGRAHTCAVDEDNRLLCWGDNTYGQVGGQLDAAWVPREIRVPTE